MSKKHDNTSSRDDIAAQLDGQMEVAKAWRAQRMAEEERARGAAEITQARDLLFDRSGEFAQQQRNDREKINLAAEDMVDSIFDDFAEGQEEDEAIKAGRHAGRVAMETIHDKKGKSRAFNPNITGPNSLISCLE